MTKGTRKYDGQRMTNQFYEDIIRKKMRSGGETVNKFITEKQVEIFGKINKGKGGEDMPVGVYKRDPNSRIYLKGAQRKSVVKQTEKVGGQRRKKEYIDISITAREFKLLKKGNTALKPLNGTGKWIAIRVGHLKDTKKIQSLQNQIYKLKQQLKGK